MHENARTLTNSMTVVVEAEEEEEEAVAVVAVSATSATKKVTSPENVQMIQMVAVIAWIEVPTRDREETRKVAPQMATGQVMVVATEQVAQDAAMGAGGSSSGGGGGGGGAVEGCGDGGLDRAPSLRL